MLCKTKKCLVTELMGHLPENADIYSGHVMEVIVVILKERKDVETVTPNSLLLDFVSTSYET